MYKAVFIDVDGTLIKSDHTISGATCDTIRKLKEKGIMVVLVSARPLHGILTIINKLGLAGFPIASLNGACITINGTIIFESTIGLDVIAHLHKQLIKYNASTIYFQQMYWFAESRNSDTDFEQKITEITITIQPFKHTFQYWQKENTAPNKVLIIASKDIANELKHSLTSNFIGQLNIYNSKPTYLEIVNWEASKLNAVRFLIDRYNIMSGEIIAIGDNFNDKEMIEYAGTGIAMGDSPDEVKTVADYVTNTNDEDGVPKAIAKFIDL
jgi:Cof subfamily protein (haloacid dehalogenase superfamily)